MKTSVWTSGIVFQCDFELPKIHLKTNLKANAIKPIVVQNLKFVKTPKEVTTVSVDLVTKEPIAKI